MLPDCAFVESVAVLAACGFAKRSSGGWRGRGRWVSEHREARRRLMLQLFGSFHRARDLVSARQHILLPVPIRCRPSIDHVRYAMYINMPVFLPNFLP